LDTTLLLLLLQKTREQPCLTLQAFEREPLRRKVRVLLQELRTQGFSFPPTIDGSYCFTKELRVRLTLLGAKEGLDFDVMVKFLSWQEFELLITVFGEEFGYSAKTGLHFSTPERKYQIDVVLKNRPYIFLIDAKHHRGSGKHSMLKDAVAAQIARCQAVQQQFAKLSQKLELEGWSKVVLLPLIITWRDEAIQFYERVPIVPIGRLRSFFQEFYLFFEDLFRLEFEQP